MSHVTINVEQFRRALAANIAAGVPTLVFAHPGIGKTEASEGVCAQFKDRFPGGCFTLSTTDFTSLDLGGLWAVEDGKTVRRPVDFIPLDKPVFILIDEFADCPAHEQSGWYRLANNHTLGNAKLAPGSYVCVASNRPRDNAAANEVSSAFKGRCSIFELRADWKVTLNYGNAHQWAPTILGFIRCFGQEVIDNGFDPNCEYAGCTPRDFDHLARLERAGVISRKDPELALAQCVSKLGPNVGAKYYAFRSIEIPDVDQVYNTPKTAVIPESIETQCSYAAAIVGGATPATWDNIVTYALRCDRVLGNGICFDLAKRHPEFKKSPAFTRAAVAYIDLYTA